MKLTFNLLFLVFLTILSGCLGTRYLEEDEYLLYKQKISGTDETNAARYTDFYRQEPNKRLPLLPVSPYIYLYQWGLNNYDEAEVQNEKKEIEEEFNRKIQEAETEGKDKKATRLRDKKSRKIAKKDKILEEGNLLMRWGEPLAIYDSAKSSEAATQMENFLHTKGFFLGETAYEIDTSGKKITVEYLITERAPYLVDSILFTTTDTTIKKLYFANQKDILIKKGQIYDQVILTAERERIDNLLKNNGFFDFSRQYVEYNVDTTITDEKRVAIEVVILDPAKRGYHKVFELDSVYFTTDAGFRSQIPRTREEFNTVVYKYYNDDYSKKILDRRLFLYPDSLYSKERTFETQRQLSNLDIFKFVNINYDTTGGKFVANIFTSPLKKYTMSNELGLTVTEQVPGPFYNFTIKDRNIFGGLEILEFSGRAGIEGVASASDPGQAFSSQELGANLSIIFPQFVFPLGSGLKSKLGSYNPKTRFLIGYNYTKRPDYTRSNSKVSAIYTWQKDQKIFYNFSLVDASIINSNNISKTFDSLLLAYENLGNNLRRSFEPSFVSSMIFYTIFNFNQYGTGGRNASYLRLYGESGGTLQNLIGTSLYENLGDTLQFYKFFKLNADFRRTMRLSQVTDFAFRINVGVAKPYGGDDALPYEKYFFAGGSSSNRGWRPRRLGPGSYSQPDSVGTYNPDEDGPINQSFEQPGEIILEANIELRRDIIGFLEGAIFLDIGNIWNFEEQGRPGSKFEFNRFYKELAVGTGIGFRFDFNFLVLRLDVGMKVYDPAREEGDRFVLDKIGFSKPYNEKYPLVYNIGIGYPF